MATTETVQVPEFRAVHRFATCTARKARLIADAIRRMPVNEALDALEFAPQRAAAMYRKVLRSAIANFYAYSATPSGGGAPAWPTLVELSAANTVMAQGIPDPILMSGHT